MLRDATTALVLVLALSGCAGIGQPKPYDSQGINGLVVPTPAPDPGDFVAEVDNPWLALEPGERRTYDVVDDEGDIVGTLVADVLEDPVPVAGLEATAVRTTTDLDGAATSTATDLYAQDDDGNVWLVGTDADGEGWRAGTDGAEAGLAMPADPRLGDGWRAYVVDGVPASAVRIEDQSAQMVQLREEAGTVTRTVYEKGAGLVSVEDVDAGWVATLD